MFVIHRNFTQFIQFQLWTAICKTLRDIYRPAYLKVMHSFHIFDRLLLHSSQATACRRSLNYPLEKSEKVKLFQPQNIQGVINHGSKIVFISFDKLRLVVAAKPQLRAPSSSFSMDVFVEKSRLGAISCFRCFLLRNHSFLKH